MARIFSLVLGWSVVIGCQQQKVESRWCDQLPRAEYAELSKFDYSDGWFEVYEIKDSIYAIYEPYQWQEVISYLILGKEFALLFDTGNGIGNINQVVRSITSLPVRVLNSHSHYDHVGGNADFDFIYGMNTEFTTTRKAGLSHEQVAEEVSDGALCKGLPPGVIAKDHQIRPYAITEIIEDGSVIDLGSRQLEVLSVPGHTPDAIALLDRKNGLLWTGDTFYAGPVWLFAEETNWEAYKNSVNRLAELSSSLAYLLPAHNLPLVQPDKLLDLREAVQKIETGELKPVNKDDGKVEYIIKDFSILAEKPFN
ncbi:MAG: MBL fold metallo-hydrolase [Cyclobacteriaceae bacterium]|nr:MBL fold metallo-hydrolase [Cyclobacteriaceae bacterium]